MDDLIVMVVPIIIFQLIMCGLMFVVYKYDVEIAEANIVNAYVDGKLVFTGKKAFIEITSGGMTTTLTVYKKLFPFNITDKVYSSKDVKVSN